MVKQTIEEKIRQRRRQMFVHCHLYYDRDVTIVSDATWIKWAKELELLQKKYPEEANRTEFASYFKDWDASTGAFLQIPENFKNLAERLYSEWYSKNKYNMVPKKIKKPERKSVNKRAGMKRRTSAKPLL